MYDQKINSSKKVREHLHHQAQLKNGMSCETELLPTLTPMTWLYAHQKVKEFIEKYSVSNCLSMVGVIFRVHRVMRLDSNVFRN